MKNHALFVIFEKKTAKFEIDICCKLGGALWVNSMVAVPEIIKASK